MSSQMKAPKNSRSPYRIVLTEMVLPYWTKSEDKWKARGLLALTLIMMGAMVYSLVLLNRWNQSFYDSLQRLDQAEFLKQLWRFFFIALAYALIVAYKFYILQSLAINWRQWLTKQNLQHWFHDKNFYFWQLSPHKADNPDQRLSEDIHELTDLSLEIFEKAVREAITFVSFIGILWGLSGSAKFSTGEYTIEISHYLVWVCLIYAVIGSGVAHAIGRPLSRLNFLQQHLEADFRYLLVRSRENGEAIALSQGEEFEKKSLLTKFRGIVGNFKDLIRKQRQLLTATTIYGQVAYIIPFVVASGKVFTREITLGQLFQISSAFGQLQGSVSVFVDLYTKIARLNSVVLRLGGFLLSLQRLDKPTTHATASKDSSVHGANLSVFTPQEKILWQNLNLSLAPGKRMALIAPSGKGKSTLLRALNDLWPYSTGEVQKPQGKKILALPQKMILPTGRFQETMTYPHSEEAFTPEALHKALDLVKLSHLAPLFDREDHWAQRLSQGEQQRLGFARILLHKPDFVLLDEATSALDQHSAKDLYKTLFSELPNLGVLALGHDLHSFDGWEIVTF